MPSRLKYQRILLKLSGESLAGSENQGLSSNALAYFSEEVYKAHKLGAQIGIVIGGGNIFRGLQSESVNLDRVTADQMGMLGTVINAMALRNFFRNRGIPTHALSAIPVGSFVETYSRDLAIEYLESGHVTIFAAGTGNPFFTTDTAGVLRAVEIKAQIILKGTRVDGVYNADPEQVEDAIKFDELSYLEVVQRGLKVMDTTAITLAMDNHLPIRVFNFNVPGNLIRIIKGESIGTIVRG